MTLALVDECLDLLADYCNLETVLIILFTIAFAVYIDLFCVPHTYYQLS